MNGYIYEIENAVNGKTYVGQRKCRGDINNDRYMGSGSVLAAAMAKYGRSNFNKRILEELPDGSDQELLNEREIYWIARRKSEGKAEYNISGGGQACSNPFMYKSDSEKKRIYAKMGKARRGKHSGSYGKFWKLDASPNPCPEHNNAREKLGKRVVIMELGRHFMCYGDCAKFLGVDQSGVQKCCHGKQGTVAGYHICHEESYDEKNNPWLGKQRGTISKKAGKKQPVSCEALEATRRFNSAVLGKPVRCIETGEVFRSAAEAALRFGTTKGSVSSVCNGKLHSTKGHTFEYMPEMKEYARLEPTIVLMETGEEFVSVKDAAKKIGCYFGGILRNLNGTTRQCVGYHFCYKKGYDEKNNPWLGKPRYSQPKIDYSKRKSPGRKRIMCAETGDVFNSIAEAGKSLGIAPQDISMVLSGKRKHAKNLHFTTVR